MNIFTKLVFLMIVSLFAFSTALEAGRLGSCKRCVTNSGIEAHLWTNGGTFQFCEGQNMNDGGDGNTTLCDAQAGIFRLRATNDPFWKCGTNASNHTIWIGGENADLIVVGKSANDINAGTFYRLQDGDEYRCGLDVASGSNFSVVKYGKNRDLLDIYVHDGNNGFARTTDNIFDGKWHAIEVGSNFVARLYGNNKDIIKLYGVRSNGKIEVKAAGIFDGRGHILHKLGPTMAGLTYGRNKDIRVTYCFTGSHWRYGYAGIGAAYTKSCNKDLTW